MIAVGTKGHNKEGRVVVKSIVLGNGEQEILLDIFVLWIPDLLTAFIDDGVLVRVVGDGGGIRQGSEEMGEELSFQGDRKWEVGEDRSGWGGRDNDSNRGFSDG
jgi:hypothetical protein